MLQSRSWSQPLSKHSFEPIRCRLLSLGAAMKAAEISRRSWRVWRQHRRSPHARSRSEASPVGLASSSGKRWGRSKHFGIELSAFKSGLETLGWKEGHNIVLEYRFSAGRHRKRGPERFAKELVPFNPDVICYGQHPQQSHRAATKRTRTIPIVFGKPVRSSRQRHPFPSLAHPGRNATGFTNFEFGIGGKWLGNPKRHGAAGSDARRPHFSTQPLRPIPTATIRSF